MKILFTILYVLAHAWTLTACAANADIQSTQKVVYIDGDAYEILANVELVKDPKWRRIPGDKIKLQEPKAKSSSPSPAHNKEHQIIARFGNMKLVRKKQVTTNQAQAGSVQNTQDSKSLFVKNMDTGKVSIVNGEIFATAASKSDARNIARDYDIKFVAYVTHVKKALFATKVNNALFDTVSAMQTDDRISQVQLRLINNLAVPY